MKETREQRAIRTGYDYESLTEFEERAWPLKQKAAEALRGIFQGFNVKQLETAMHDVELMLKSDMRL